MASYTYKYRMYPTKAQEAKLASHFGAVRYVYNHFLDQRKKLYLETKKGTTFFTQCKELTLLKKELTWLKDTNSQAFQYSLKCLEAAYNNFFKRRARFPKFHSRKGKQKFTAPQHTKVVNCILYIPKFKEGLKLQYHRPIEGEIKKTTISKSKAGQYFACILVEKDIPTLPKNDNAVGIDLGLNTFAALSNGKTFRNLRTFRKWQAKLKLAQQSFSRKEKGSNNIEKARKAVAKIHNKIANVRNDYLHKVSKKIVNENQVIVMEDLNVKGMLANRKLAKSIADVSFSELVRMLKYKCEWYGRTFLQIDRWFPSSKTCSGCFFIMDKLPLNIREWECPKCGEVHDRDYNASVNILREGIRTVGTTGIACGLEVRLFGNKERSRTKQEAATPLG